MPAGSKTNNIISFGDFLVGWMRLRTEKDSIVHHRVLKRSIHFFSQQVEEGLQKHSTSTMPAPREGKQHPFQKYIRYTGGKSLLRSHLAQRFMVRGGGFVSVKEEKSLLEMGLVNKRSPLGSKTALQFGALHLIKAVELTQAVLARSPMPVLNFSIDAARVFKQQAICDEIVWFICSLHSPPAR